MPRKGRKRKDGYREPNGQVQRQPVLVREQDARQIALEARQRVFGLSEEDAARMPETTVLGHLRATGEVSSRQYEAGVAYRAVVQDYDRYMLARGLPKPGDMDRGHGFDGADGTDPAYVAAFRAAVQKYLRCWDALDDADREAPHGNAAGVVNTIVIADWARPNHTHVLRIGLNHLGLVLDNRQKPAE